jgi:hypothetical protein
MQFKIIIFSTRWFSMKTNRYLAIIILISLIINVGLGWYVLNLSSQIDQQKTNYYVVNTNNQMLKHTLFLLLKDDILLSSSDLLNQSVIDLGIGENNSVIYNIDQVLASFRYFSWAAQNLGSAYLNMSEYVNEPRTSMLSNLIEIRNSVFYGNYTQADINYLQKVANNLNSVADNLLETGVGQFTILNMDTVVTKFYEIESMTPT